MTKKIFQSILLVAGCVLLASLLIIMGFLYDYFGGVEENQLRDELSLAAAAVEDGGAQFRREDAEGAEARQGAALDVAAGADAHQFDLVSERPQPVGDQLGLADGERGAARAEPEPHPSTRSTPRITGAMPLPSSQAPTRSTPTPAALRRRRSRVEGSILAGIADHSTEANAAT